jgi:hypothetical protein
VRGDLASEPREEPFGEVVELALERNLAAVIDGGVEAEEIEPLRRRGDGGQFLAVASQDGFLEAGRQIRRERDVTEVVHRWVVAEKAERCSVRVFGDRRQSSVCVRPIDPVERIEPVR